MPIIEIMTDAKSEMQLNKIMDKNLKNNATILYVKGKNVENIKNIKLETTIINQKIEDEDIVSKLVNNSKNIIINMDYNENINTINKVNKKIITFGYNSNSNITVSSIEDDEVILYIQKSIKSIYGKKIEPQEIKIGINAGINIYDIMIIIALNLLYAK